MSKQVRETAAGQSIRAIVVLNKKGEHVATVQAHFSNGGTVTVDVWNELPAARRCAERAGIPASNAAADEDQFGLQQGRAGGGGYDKFAAALAGLLIDGHTIADHCGRVPEAEKARAKLLDDYHKAFAAGMRADDESAWQKKAAKLGCRFANWMSGCGWQSLHFIAGLERLESLGYRVINAI